MKKLAALLLLITSSSITAIAQVPGYIGKKLAATYEVQTSPAMMGPNGNNRVMFEARAEEYGLEKRFASFNWKHSVTADYVTGRKASVGGGVSFYKTRVLFNHSVNDTTNGFSYGGSNYSFVPMDVTGKVAKGDISVAGFSFYVKKFGKKYIAPMGSYNKFELFALKSTTTYKTRDFSTLNFNNYYYGYPATAYVGAGKDSHMFFGIAWTVGKQRIVSDKVVIDYGLRFGYLFGTLNAGTDQSLSMDNPYNETNYIRSTTLRRLARNEGINFKLAIGFLN